MDSGQGVVCTPAKQTHDLQAMAAMSSSDIGKWASSNLYTRSGRLSFVKDYDHYYKKGTEWWTEEDETRLENEYKDDELAFYFAFMAFKNNYNAVSTLMSSMNEGNHRVQCVDATAGGRKVHKLVPRVASRPDEKSQLSKEYLMKKGKGISDNFLFVEGRTSVSSGIWEVMKDDSELMVTVNFSIPTRENDSMHPIGSDLIYFRNESMEFSKEKHSSSSQSDFKKVVEELKKVFRTIGQTESNEPREISRCFSVINKGARRKFFVRPGAEKGANKWGGTVIRVLHGDAVNTMQVKVGGNVVTYPFLPETLPQLKLRTRTAKPNADPNNPKPDIDWALDDLPIDLIELNLAVFGTNMFQYCMKKHGDASDDRIREVAKMFLSQRYYNLSQQRRHNTSFLEFLGDDQHKGVAAAMYLQSLYMMGSIYGRQNEVISCIGSLGIASRAQEQHWNYLSKYDLIQYLLGEQK